jgi:hypothetical protein
MRLTRAAARTVLLLLAARAVALSPPEREVAAVLSSASGPYQDAFAGFVKEFGGEVASVRLPEAVPSARVIVAFGAEAASRPYPASATLIACLAPGLGTRVSHRGAFVFVTMKPAPAKLLADLRRLQPGLGRLAVLSSGRDTARYVADLRRAGAALGVEIVAPRVLEPGGVPRALRALSAARADALWLAPDPGLATPENFQTIKQFSWDNSLPFYAPTRGLAAAGAAAAAAVSPGEEGRLAAELAKRALAGEALPDLVYPARTEITVNPRSARKAGLQIPREAAAAGIEVLP